MARKEKKIKVIIHIPENKNAMIKFEKKIADFYVAQIEKKISPLPKKQKLEALDALLEIFNSEA